MATLCEPSSEAIDLIVRLGSGTVVEIGAGDGRWARALRLAGLAVHAYDTQPSGDGVSRGDHTDAAAHSGLMLAIWPPDGPMVAEWVSAASWPVVALCGDHMRFDVSDALDSYDEVERISLPPGLKGGSQLVVYRRAAP